MPSHVHHIGVDSGVVCSIIMGNARASMRGMDSRMIPRFFMSLIGIDKRYMKTDTPALSNAISRRGGIKPPDVGLASYVSPEAIRSGQGVSSDYAPKENHRWFVLRATYGRSEQAYDALVKNHIEAYIPKHYVVKQINGKKKRIKEPLLPNFVFVYSTLEEIRDCIKENPEISYLRFYRNKTKDLNLQDGKHPPLTIEYHEMMNFIRTTSIDDEHIKLVDVKQCHYKSGDLVRVVDGKFRGVVGRVARIGGQQTVVVEIEGLCLIATAYVPSAFLEYKKE